MLGGIPSMCEFASSQHQLAPAVVDLLHDKFIGAIHEKEH
jgi:hypothetical protein